MDEKRLLNAIRQAPYRLSVYQRLRDRAIGDSAEYAEQHLGEAMIFNEMRKIWNYSAGSAHLEGGLILEFGVFKGRSINHFAKIFADDTVHGFDSFEGLAEDWTGYHLPKGAFDLEGELPKVDANVILHKGWFDATLPKFLEDNKGDIRFCHIDCDTFESALYVLQTIAKRLVKGSIIVFDEYYGYPNWRHGEFRAWQTVCKEYNFGYRYIAFANMQVAVELV